MEAVSHSSLLHVAEVELIYRNPVKPSQRPKITSAKDTYELLLNRWDADKISLVEQFKVLLLNQGSRVLGMYELSSGGISSTVADIRLIFAAALKAGATGIILSHNHPSGNLKPSREDIVLTNQMVSAGIILNIKVLDHIILSAEDYYSFSTEGKI